MLTHTITARWVFPVSGAPLARGTVTVSDGKIVAVEARGARTPDEDLGNVALIPGLVNAHTHLDLSGARGRIPPTDPDHFTDWLRGVIAYRRGRTPEQVQADIRDGLAECLRSGTTLIGDIAAEGASWDTLAAAPTRAVVYYEVVGLTNPRLVAAGGAAKKWFLSRSPHTQAVALEKLRASGVVIKQWSPELLGAFRRNSDIMLKDRGERDADFAAAWANQKAFVAQGVSWRSLSRLP